MKTDTPRTDEEIQKCTMVHFITDDNDDGFVVKANFTRQLELELTAVTEQRDRLAEAMTRIKTIYENPEKGCIPSSSDMYDEALQSLTTNKL